MKVIISKGPYGSFRYWIGMDGRGNCFAKGKSYQLEHCRQLAWMILGFFLKGEGNPSKRGTNDYEWEEFI
jgi:hypothetical protein